MVAMASNFTEYSFGGKDYPDSRKTDTATKPVNKVGRYYLVKCTAKKQSHCQNSVHEGPVLIH